jgi:hypothetical protein
MNEHVTKILILLVFLILLVQPVLAGTNWMKEKNRIFNQVDDWKAEGDRALEGGDYEEALGAYNQAIAKIKSAPLTEAEKNAHLSTLYTKKYDTYLLRALPGDDALAREAQNKADSYKNAHSGSLLDMFPCYYTAMTTGTGVAGAAQELRDFRENTVYTSYSGKQFMNTFYQGYYSFSPAVVQFTEAHPASKIFVQMFITPSIAILLTASWIYPVLAFNPEFAVMATGLVASAMTGMVYGFLPALAVLLFGKKYSDIFQGFNILRIAGGIWMGSILFSGAGILLGDPALTSLGTVAFVGTTGIISAGLTGISVLSATSRVTNQNTVNVCSVPGGIL